MMIEIGTNLKELLSIVACVAGVVLFFYFLFKHLDKT
jgi:hypothetical protein